MTRAEILTRLRQWLVEKNSELAAHDLDDDTPIVEQRILSSLQVASLLLYIEQLRGAPIDIESLQPGAFRSLATIYQHFFSGASHA
jgi:acyl carrier protein